MAGVDEFKAGLMDSEGATDLIEALFAGTDISLLDLVKIQAQVLVPVLKAFRAELGEERANQIATKALREWSRKVYKDIGEGIPGSPKKKWEAIFAASAPRIGGDIDMEFLKQEPEALDFNVTGCRYADFFRQLGEPELGAVLLCEVDRDIEEVGSPEVELERTQTIMKGAPYCDFRHWMKVGGASK